MNCERCGLPTSALETRNSYGGTVLRRARICANKHRVTTYEISQAAFNSAKYDIQRANARQAYNQKIEALRVQKALMLAERLAGVDCIQLASKYGMSVHMARYYTRLPRAKLYPSAKAKDETT